MQWTGKPSDSANTRATRSQIPGQDFGYIGRTVRAWERHGAWMMPWNGQTVKLMVDFVGKIWYNARREGKYPLAPFAFSQMRMLPNFGIFQILDGVENFGNKKSQTNFFTRIKRFYKIFPYIVYICMYICIYKCIYVYILINLFKNKL